MRAALEWRSQASPEIRDEHARHAIELRREHGCAGRKTERRQDELVRRAFRIALKRHGLRPRGRSTLAILLAVVCAPHAPLGR